MRIAFLDLLFSWPPHGGADVDVYYVANTLREQGHEVMVFITRDLGTWERGQVDIATLPFDATVLEFPAGGMTEPALTARAREALSAWRPEVVLLTQGYFLKTALIEALHEYPLVSRCYAHETACHQDILRFKDGAPCPKAYAETPDVCRRCALHRLAPAIRREHHSAWTHEYLAARAYARDYHQRFLKAMDNLAAVIITTEYMRTQVSKLCRHIAVIPHGIDTTRFTPPAEEAVRHTPTLLIPGRIEDPAKGFALFVEAGQQLAAEGYTFEARVTLPEGHGGPPWLKSIGKFSYEDMPAAYQSADICVVPSVWEEPFGLVALEAMATAVPVCASKTGGLQDIVVDGETGLLFARGDADALKQALKRLLDHPHERRAMGRAGRRRAIEQYQWRHLVDAHYPALFEQVRSAGIVKP